MNSTSREVDELPLLDQVSSQALVRLAASRGGPIAVVPAGEEVVMMRRPAAWKRAVPALFLLLSLAALAGMVLGIGALAEDGWSWGDAVQLALMVLLVTSVFTQAKGVLRRTPMRRWLGTNAVDATREPPADPATLFLDAVSAEEMAARRPAARPASRRRASAKRLGGQWFERSAVVAVVVLGALAFAGMVFLAGYIALQSGIGDPALWLTAPFTALTGFGAWQVFGSARRAAFRGRPLTLLSRAFRDSVRVWGSGSLVSRVAMTTTATASVAGAAAVPAILGPSIPVDLFIVDANAAVYRIDLDTLTSFRVGNNPTEARAVGLATAGTPITLAEGRKLPAGSILSVIESRNGAVQRIVAFRPGSRQPVPLGEVTPAIQGARFAGGPGVLYAVQQDGAFWTVDPKTGAATRVGQLTVAPGPMTYDAGAKVLFMVTGNELIDGPQLVRIDPVTRSVLSSAPLPRAGDPIEVCGLARGPGDRMFITQAGTGAVFVVRLNARTMRPVPVTGEAAAGGCLMTLAKRK